MLAVSNVSCWRCIKGYRVKILKFSYCLADKMHQNGRVAKHRVSSFESLKPNFESKNPSIKSQKPSLESKNPSIES